VDRYFFIVFVSRMDFWHFLVIFQAAGQSGLLNTDGHERRILLERCIHSKDPTKDYDHRAA